MTDRKQEERERFEAWAETELGRPPTPDGSGNYAVYEVRWAWRAWQAAKADSSGALQLARSRIQELEAALEGLMEVERRGRFMPIGREWDAARSVLNNKEPTHG